MRDEEIFSVAFGAFFALDAAPDSVKSSPCGPQQANAKEAYVNTIQEYRRAAETGNRAAQEMLALMYLYGSQLDGEGIARDLHEARYWLELAAAQDSVLARQLLRRYILNRTDRGVGTPMQSVANFGGPGLEAA
jgi:TPR repeat protein